MAAVFDTRQSDRRTTLVTTFRRTLGPLLLALALGAFLPGAAAAQPFGAWMTLVGSPTHGFVQIPHSPALNPTGAITIEAWVSLRDPTGGCSSIIGKNFQQAYWVGVCGTTLRAYFRGNGSLRDAGTIPVDVWTHIAVVYDGTTQRHYVNGELAQSFSVSGPPTTSGAAVRIGSDAAWQVTPDGSIDEVRLWNVARTQAQIRSTINVPLSTPQPGLVAVWPLDGNTADVIGSRHGTVGGSGVGALTFPVAAGCSSTPTSLCLDGRFVVSVKFRTAATPGTPLTGIGQRVLFGTADSGLFWFFSPENWEIMVKALNGCGLNDRHWVFSAATTNVFYRLEVFDIRAGVQKMYFNYPGPPAPAVTDTSAFATCP